MKFEYLQRLKDNLLIGGKKCEGLDESEIALVEADINIKFPKAYREFLLLAGEYSGGLQLHNGHNDLKTLSKRSYLKTLDQKIRTENLVFDDRFWVFTEMDGFDQFAFFYFNDEDQDNPTVFELTYGFDDTSHSTIYSTQKKFSDYINEIIDLSKKYAKRDW